MKKLTVVFLFFSFSIYGQIPESLLESCSMEEENKKLQQK